MVLDKCHRELCEAEQKQCCLQPRFAVPLTHQDDVWLEMELLKAAPIALCLFCSKFSGG